MNLRRIIGLILILPLILSLVIITIPAGIFLFLLGFPFMLGASLYNENMIVLHDFCVFIYESV